MGLLSWLSNLRASSSGVLSVDGSGTNTARTSLLRADTPARSLPSDSLMEPLQSEEQRYVQRRIRDNPMWTLDRGTGYYDRERISKKKASLISTGKDAGKSKVLYRGIQWTTILRHVWRRDFFTTAVHSRLNIIVVVMILVFICSFLFWACVYYVIWRFDESCFLGFNSFLSAFLFSIETQNTIGYGSHAIGDCWLPAWLVGIQCILAVLLEAVFLGIMLAKISHPKGRSRTILISECACIARRDGILKFMFRVADIRKRTAIAPRIQAVLYTWGPGHTTAEGEHVPVMVQPLPLHYLDATLLLPVTVEHTIDERSPLYGHTNASLAALSAEVVVTFEAQSELGDAFMSRQSYLPTEIHWGCMFVNIIHQAEPGSTAHSIDLARFHEVEPTETLALMPPVRLSRAVVLGGARRVPWPRLGENTLLLADELVVTQTGNGRWVVAVRVGDVYPSQMCSVNVKMFVYRFESSSSSLPAARDQGVAAVVQQQTYCHLELPLSRHLWSNLETEQQQQQQRSPTAAAAAAAAAATGEFVAGTQQQQQQSGGGAGVARPEGVFGEVGGVNVLLRYPVVVGHEIGPHSPLWEWVTPDGMLKDADAEIVVVATATMYVTSHLSMRSKVYSVLGSIRWGHSYAPCVIPPKRSPTGHALVDWGAFHDVNPTHPAARSRGSRRTTQQQQQQDWQQLSVSPSNSSCSSSLQASQLQQLHCAAGAFGSQVMQTHDLLSDAAANNPQQQQQQQGQQQLPCGSSSSRGQQGGQGSSRSSSIRDDRELGSIVVHDGGAWMQQQQQQQYPDLPGSAAAGGTGSMAVVQDQPSDDNSGDEELHFAHSLGFRELHDAQVQEQQQQWRRRQQQQPHAMVVAAASNRMRLTQQQQGFGRQGVSSAAELHAASAAGSSQEAASSSSSDFSRVAAAAAAAGWDWHDEEEPEAGAAPAATGREVQRLPTINPASMSAAMQRQQQYEDAHALTMLPGSRNSWAGKRSLAAAVDLFDAAGDEQEMQPEGAVPVPGVPAARSSIVGPWRSDSMSAVAKSS